MESDSLECTNIKSDSDKKVENLIDEFINSLVPMLSPEFPHKQAGQ